MKKNILFFFVIFLLVFQLLITGCITGNIILDNNKIESKQIAENWILTQSQTYLFDGYKLNYKISSKFDGCKTCYSHKFSFMTKHTGYGNRSDEELDQFIMYHDIIVIANTTNVISAVIDNEWNEFSNKEIPYKVPSKTVSSTKIQSNVESDIETAVGKDAKNALKQRFLCRLFTAKCPESENPVCGNDGKTYSNSCVACKNDDDVQWYYLGECD